MAKETEIDNAVAFAEINGRLDQVLLSIETVKEKQEEMAEDIAKIKNSVYNPDLGLYTRIRKLERVFFKDSLDCYNFYCCPYCRDTI